MTIQEILDEHYIDDDDQCPCGCDVRDEVTRSLTTHELRIAHLAEVLDKHMQEQETAVKAEALTEAAQAYPSMLRDMVSRPSVVRWLRDRADQVRQEADTK